MEWFWHNFIADMNGPSFLGFYAATSALVIVAGFLGFYVSDRSLDLEPIETEVATPPDPYRVAYLAGNGNQVIRTLILELVDRGLLVRVGKDNDALQSTAGDISKLTAEQRIVYEYCEKPRKPSDLFGSKGPTKELKPYFDRLREQLENDQLLTPTEWRVTGNLASTLIIMLLAGLAIYKIVIALSRGKSNLGFLIILSIVSVLAAIFILAPRRVTRRGKAYLENLRLAFRGLEEASDSKPKKQQADLYPGLASTVGLTVALFGVAALSEEFVDYRTMFAKSGSGGFGSCGTSCGSSCGGSSCGGGSGCGGGCGGCGGGD